MAYCGAAPPQTCLDRASSWCSISIRSAVQSKSRLLLARSSHGRKEHGKNSKKVDDVNRMIERMDEDVGGAAPGLRRFDLSAREPCRGHPIGEQSRRKSDPHGTAGSCRRGVHAGCG